MVGSRRGRKKNHQNGEGHQLDSVKCISWESKLNILEKKQDNQLQILNNTHEEEIGIVLWESIAVIWIHMWKEVEIDLSSVLGRSF